MRAYLVLLDTTRYKGAPSCSALLQDGAGEKKTQRTASSASPSQRNANSSRCYRAETKNTKEMRKTSVIKVSMAVYARNAFWVCNTRPNARMAQELCRNNSE